jgi:hypothetical protein
MKTDQEAESNRHIKHAIKPCRVKGEKQQYQQHGRRRHWHMNTQHRVNKWFWATSLPST